MSITIDTTSLAGLLVLTPRVFADDRGAFSETWNALTLARHGIVLDFVQDNQSVNRLPGTVRGLHYQTPPHAQDKLIRVVRGAVLDVAVDFRRGSPTFGHWFGTELTEENGRQMLVPKGFLHGFVTRRPDTVVLYKTTDVYAPDCDRCITFADPDLGIDWGLDPARAILSDKDRNAPAFAEVESPFDMDGGAS